MGDTDTKEHVGFFSFGDVTRALAIFLVILTHANPDPASFNQIPQEAWRWWVANIYNSVGVFGVPLFVMLSGALLLNPSKVDEPLRTYFRKRLMRIGLPLAFWGMAYFAWQEFANHERLTFDSIWRGFLGNNQYPYWHFWFVYMLIGLYLVTPILRVLIAHAGPKILTYFIVLWFLGTAIMPLLGQFSSVWLNSDLFITLGWVGYFVLGAYLRTVRLRSWVLYVILFLGFTCTVVGTWFVTVSAGGHLTQTFNAYLSANVILASTALFLLLWTAPADRFENRFPHTYQLLSSIGQSSLGIYLFHVMVLEVLTAKGLFGFNLGVATLNPIFAIPILSFATLIISFSTIWVLKKVPMLNKAIG